MSTLISADPGALRRQADQIEVRSAEAEGEFAAVEDHLAYLGAAFRGDAATAFEERFEKWRQSSKGLVEALEGLGSFLSGAAKGFESTDKSIAAGLGGGSGGSANAQIGARVEELRQLESRLKSLTNTLDGDAKSLLAKLGLSQAEIGGRRTYDEIGSFQRGWSDSRKRIVESADAAALFMKTTADAFESLNAELLKAISGE